VTQPAPPATTSPGATRAGIPVQQPTPPSTNTPGTSRPAVPVTRPATPKRRGETTTPVPPPPLPCWGREPVPVLLYPVYQDWVGVCRGTTDCIPTVYLLEEYVVTTQEEPEQVEYCLAPDLARISHAHGEVLMDARRDLLAQYDRDNKQWHLQSLREFEARIDSTTAILLQRLEKLRGPQGLPHYEPSGDGPRVAHMETQRFHLYVETESFPGELEEFEEEIWLASRELLAWSETYPTYQRIVHLYDQMWRDVPIERPDGVVVHTTLRRRPAGGSADFDWEIEKASIVEVEYRCMPEGFFQLPPEVEAQSEGLGLRSE
jgi:hypothetical protein